MPGDEQAASQESEMDHRRGTDRLRLLSTMHREEAYIKMFAQFGDIVVKYRERSFRITARAVEGIAGAAVGGAVVPGTGVTVVARASP